MERKTCTPNGQSYGLHQTMPAQRENCRKILHFGRSNVPRLPPIVQHDLQVSTNVTKTVISENVSPRDAVSISSTNKQPLRPSDGFPRLERAPFSANTRFIRSKNGPQTTTRSYDKTYEKPDLRSQGQLDMMRVERTKKPEISTISEGFLRGRRKKKDRLSSYKCESSGEVIDDEISGFERRAGFDSLSGNASQTQGCVKDMKGRWIRSSDIYSDGVTNLISVLDHDEDEKSKKSIKKDAASDSPKIPEKSNPIRERFLKALDTHFYNEFMTANCGRRMAICEELEKLISGDGKTSLNGLREHLRLQDVLDSWVL